MKTRTITRTRQVPHTVDGHTEMVDEQYTVETPQPPRDWDQIVRHTVTVLACLLVTVSLTWTTASIGDLLSMAVTPAVAYGAGIAFDTAWILCMAVEWLLRYHPKRATLPRRAGHWALAVSMAAVYAHGHLTGQWVVGAAGAAVSLLAKGGWTIAMRAHARPLDPRTEQWVAKRRAAVDGQLAMIPIRRELQRGQGLVEAERLALGHAEEQPDTAPEESIEPAHPAVELRGAPGTPVEDLATLRGAHGPVVYFLANGNRIKIGTTRDVTGRVNALCLRPSDVRCAFHGGRDIERRFHALFAPYRVGDTEWFENTGDLASFIDQHTDASPDTPDDAHDASPDADDATADAPQVNEPQQPPIALPQTSNKTALILAASSALHPDARPADVAHLLARHGHAVDTAYIRTVLSRNPRPEDGVGKGGGGYA